MSDDVTKKDEPVYAIVRTQRNTPREALDRLEEKVRTYGNGRPIGGPSLVRLEAGNAWLAIQAMINYPSQA